MVHNVKSSQLWFHYFFIAMVVVIVISAIYPYKWELWFAHSSWVFILLTLLTLTRHRFLFTPLAYTVMFVYGTTMMIGAHYSYEHEPFFNYLQETLMLSRNHTDRFAHFLQGFTPAIIIRELYIRHHVVTHKKWLTFLTLTTAITVSVFNEIIEWWYALLANRSPEISLGMQGDVWDTQWDMLLAFVGASVSIVLLSKLHNRQIDRYFKPKKIDQQ